MDRAELARTHPAFEHYAKLQGTKLKLVPCFGILELVGTMREVQVRTVRTAIMIAITRRCSPRHWHKRQLCGSPNTV